MPAQLSSSSCHDIPFPMLKEQLADVIDELVNVSNRCKINSLIEKFDTKATKAHRMMQQAQEDMITAQTDCFNAIRDVLAGHDSRMNGSMQRLKGSTTTCNKQPTQQWRPPTT
jgi:hypothetical protein